LRYGHSFKARSGHRLHGARRRNVESHLLSRNDSDLHYLLKEIPSRTGPRTSIHLFGKTHQLVSTISASIPEFGVADMSRRSPGEYGFRNADRRLHFGSRVAGWRAPGCITTWPIQLNRSGSGEYFGARTRLTPSHLLAILDADPDKENQDGKRGSH
jgi:hypothetical protein